MSTASRLRENPSALFDVFCEIGASFEKGSPSGMELEMLPIILQKYPDDFNEQKILDDICKFAFPCGLEDQQGKAVQIFSFVFTDNSACFTYGFCRHMPKSNTCLCILSALPWTSLFYKFLNHLATVMNNGTQAEVDSLLIRAYHTEIPGAGETFTVESSLGKNKLEVIVPDLSKLSTLRDDKYMLEFYNAVPEKLMISIYASLLKERQILITGKKLSQLSSCVFAASTLIYPMHWQRIFIPVLPQSLITMISMPMPFLIGVPKRTLDVKNGRLNLFDPEFSDIVIVDLDSKIVSSSHNDIIDLPGEILYVLKTQLKSSADLFLSDGLSRSFLRATVALFGGYRLGMVRSEDGIITWSRVKFLAEQRQSLRNYLSSLIGTDGVQYFEQFINERLTSLNDGKMVDDEFERELHLVGGTRRIKTTHSTSSVGLQKKAISDANLIPILSGKNVMNPLNQTTSSGRNLSSKMPIPLSNTTFQWSPFGLRRKDAKSEVEIGVSALDEFSLTTPKTDSDTTQLSSLRINGSTKTIVDECERYEYSTKELLPNEYPTKDCRSPVDLIYWNNESSEVQFDPLLEKVPRKQNEIQSTSNVQLLSSIIDYSKPSKGNVDKQRKVTRKWEQFD